MMDMKRDDDRNNGRDDGRDFGRDSIRERGRDNRGGNGGRRGRSLDENTTKQEKYLNDKYSDGMLILSSKNNSNQSDKLNGIRASHKDN